METSMRDFQGEAVSAICEAADLYACVAPAEQFSLLVLLVTRFGIEPEEFAEVWRDDGADSMGVALGHCGASVPAVH